MKNKVCSRSVSENHFCTEIVWLSHVFFLRVTLLLAGMVDRFSRFSEALLILVSDIRIYYMCSWDDLGRNAPEMHFPAGIFRNALFLWFLHFWLKFCIQERAFFEECSRNALLECNFGMLQKCTFPRVFQFFCCSGKDF